jgi:biotin carboxylase
LVIVVVSSLVIEENHTSSAKKGKMKEYPYDSAQEGVSVTQTLLIIGAGVEQVPAYERAKARGFTVVGSDGNPNAPALAYADHTIIASTRDAEESVLAATTFHQTHPIHGVMTIANDVPYTVARVAHALKLRGISLEAAECASNKLKMKEHFAQAGVACPWFQEITSLEELQALLLKHPGERYVLKPIDGRGARGVLVLTERSNLAWAFKESTQWGDSGRLMLEKFIPGLQLSTETFLLDGKCYTPAISERNYARLEQFAPYVIEDGGTLPALLSKDQRIAIDNLILRGAAAMGIHHGIVKGDLVINPEGEPMIIELAARLSGGWFATHQIPDASGVDLVNAVISDALSLPVTPAELTPTRHRANAIRFWFPEPGLIQDITGEAQLTEIPGYQAHQLYRHVGETQPLIRCHPDRFGYVIISAETREEVLKRADQAVACVKITVQADKTLA